MWASARVAVHGTPGPTLLVLQGPASRLRMQPAPAGAHRRPETLPSHSRTQWPPWAQGQMLVSDGGHLCPLLLALCPSLCPLCSDHTSITVLLIFSKFPWKVSSICFLYKLCNVHFPSEYSTNKQTKSNQESKPATPNQDHKHSPFQKPIKDPIPQ